MNDNMAIVKEKLENLTIKAPISGQLTSLNAEIGQTKTVGERLGQIDVVDSFKITAMIDEYWISNILQGMKGTVEIDGVNFDVFVRKVYPEVKNGSFETEFNFTNIKPTKIRRGQTVFINISLSESKNALLLKRGSFYQSTGGQWVYILDNSNNEATKRKISLGRQNPNYYEILNGLNPGDKVIISDYSNYSDNDVIKLK
jgi:HlyD family secretion protein